jgi:photosystem II protein
MIIEIQFISGIKETTSPIVKLTRSLNRKTGTATFLFFFPSTFDFFFNKNQPIEGMFLLWENKQIFTKDIQIFFKQGKPFLLKSIVIFKNSFEWFNFLNFMNLYSKEKGLLFEIDEFDDE